MVSTVNNANNDNTAEDQMAMLQAQIQELLRKGTTDQLRHEEGQRKQEEERRQQVEEMA